MRALRAALLYFAVVFAAGFFLGTIRSLLLVPRLGEARAILVEAPLMLAVSLVAARFVVRRLAVPARLADRLQMGLIAFVLLMLAEILLGMMLFATTPAATLAAMVSPVRLPGFMVQLLFAALPALLLVRR